MPAEIKPPICPYCDKPSIYRESSARYYGGKDYGPVWVCDIDRAWVGVHRGTKNPLGTLADSALRKARMNVHAAFDPIWREPTGKTPKGMRSRAYKWLAAHMGIAREGCHIAHFDIDGCKAALACLASHKPTRESIIEWSDAQFKKSAEDQPASPTGESLVQP